MTVCRTLAGIVRRALARRAAAALLGLSAVVVAVTASPRPALAQAGAPTRIAVVNTQRVFNDMQETKALNVQMGEENKRAETEARTRQGNLQKMQKERDEGYKPGTPQWDEANERLLKATTEFKVWLETEKARTEWVYKRQVKQLFEKVQAATAEVAQKQGFDLVIADVGEQPPVDLNQIDLRNLKALMLQKSVLYAGPKSDITATVIITLDAKYKAAGGK